MSLAETHGRLRIPDSLRAQLGAFRRRVRLVKLAEAALIAAFVFALAYLVLFGLDRAIETPLWSRLALFAASALGLLALPIAAYKWVWGSRQLEQLARILGVVEPRLGDRLLGVIELAQSESEQKRSLRLCEAAIEQVAEDASKRDFGKDVPHPRHRAWGVLAAIPLAVIAGLFVAMPLAASNAWVRLVAPWSSTPRYTFAAMDSLPTALVVPHGEPFTLTAALAPQTAWKPEAGVARLGTQQPIQVRRSESAYTFSIPPQIAAGWLDLRIGDYRHRMKVDPQLRPELTAVVAEVALPSYLDRPKRLQRDVRGGSVSLVKGSVARFAATASRDLASGHVDGKPRVPVGPTLTGESTIIDASRPMEVRWKDTLGLEGKAPFSVAINGKVDEAPTISVEDLPRQKVVLDIETLTYKVRAADDFGVKRVGIEWQGAPDPTIKTPAKGEKTLAAGGGDKEALDIRGTFSAKALGIEPQAVALRVFAEDYLPGRARVYSPTYILYILDPEQHAIWLTEQLSKWHRQSLEVRDRELQLYETNKQIRSLSSEDLDRPETRRRIENQASAERLNGRRLSGLVMSGEDLVKQAARNPEFGVGHLEKWAEMLQILKDISANRMPSVADLLKQAATAPVPMASNPPKSGPKAGENKGPGGAGKPAEVRTGETRAAPTVVDAESQQQPADKGELTPGGKKNPSSPSLKLAVTTLNGKPTPVPPVDAPPIIQEAVNKQEELLAEFEKIAEELNKVLANLEGSTLVKRLKAASRGQSKIAGRIGDGLGETFGVADPRVKPEARKVLAEMGEQEQKGSLNISTIMDDLESYFERRRFQKFKVVLDDMRAQDVVGGLRQLGDDLKRENGVSIALCEFWSDSMDRWAEDLVDPANSGSCPGGKSRDSLPPSVVLEVLQILEAEINLREETRVAEQAKAAITKAEHAQQAGALGSSQKVLTDRIIKVTDRIRDLKDGEEVFAYEINLLEQVEDVMTEATSILKRPETGKLAIAAETEAIELLLKSKRINPGGGGGGSDPGGGGGGKTNDSALALLGKGANVKEVREDRGVQQSSGEAGSTLPEEFRAGLDEYFNKLEGRPGGR